MTEKKKPVYIVCKKADCKHRWICLYTPMNLDTAIRVMRSMSKYCPKCGSRGAYVWQRKSNQARLRSTITNS